jgi:hypothetical protein
MKSGEITVDDIKELAGIVAGLVREGIVVNVRKDEFTKLWIIELRGY